MQSVYRRRTASGETTQPARIVDPEERRLLEALRAGSEPAFAELLGRYGPSMLRVATLYVSTRAVAEEVVQEAWLGVFAGLPRFEGRSSIKTWIFRILTNTAKTRGEREGRSVPFSSLAGDGEDEDSVVEADRFLGADHRWAGHWASTPRSPRDVPEERLLAGEARERIAAAIASLPPNQRTVITLRDVDGFDAEEACEILGVSEANQRVLLHRARGKVRQALEDYLEEEAAASAPEDITCREIVDIVTEYLEGTMTDDEREQVELHLNLCDGCGDYLEQMRLAIALSGRIDTELLSPELEAELIEAFRGLRR